MLATSPAKIGELKLTPQKYDPTQLPLQVLVSLVPNDFRPVVSRWASYLKTTSPTFVWWRELGAFSIPRRGEGVEMEAIAAAFEQHSTLPMELGLLSEMADLICPLVKSLQGQEFTEKHMEKLQVLLHVMQ